MEMFVSDSKTGKEETGIRLTSGSIVRAILFVLLFIFLYLLRDLLLIILTAVVIASAIEPATKRLERIGVPRVLGVLGIYLTIAIGVALIVYFFLPPLLTDVAGLISTAPEYISSLEIGGKFPFLSSDTISGQLSAPEFISEIRGFLTGASGGAISLLSFVFGGVLSLLLIVVISFYLAVQRDGIANFLRVVTPFKYETYIIDLWSRSQRKIGRWMQGQLILSLLVAVLVFLGLTILGVPNALILALLAGIFELIPLFGPILSAIPAVSIALVDGGVTLGLMTVGLYVIIQQFENHLLHPLVVNKVVGVPPLVVIISLIVGAQLVGFLGILLSVPVAAAVMEYMNDLEKRKQRLHEAHRVAQAGSGT